eukprot:m.32955 g.32955  ORF g.32955 m.32955 type:complete len:261 (+) comp42672_c0_seq1:270-1052(+)
MSMQEAKMAAITQDQIDFFRTNGWLLTDTLTSKKTEIQQWVDEIASWPLKGGDWLHYREQTETGPKLCRTENFTPFHKGMYDALRTGEVIEIVSALMGEPAVLYKEKINYKLTGGAGYSPHQDAPAYPFIDTHISVMIAVDDATLENGCLEVVDAHHQEVLPMNEKGCIRQDIVESMKWHPAELKAGQTLFFHSRTPHRSGPNNSSKDRRALYPTYNALREGDLRDAYYKEKLATFAQKADDGATVRVSLIGDFEGKRVD